MFPGMTILLLPLSKAVVVTPQTRIHQGNSSMKRCMLLILLVINSIPLRASEPTNSAQVKTAKPAVYEVGTRRELFVEDTLIDRFIGKAELRMHHPVPQDVVLEHDAPWEGSGSVYHNIFRDGDKFRMYYAAGHLEVTPKGVNAGTHGQYCCYAESSDGIHWVKPMLGLHEFQGSTANNIVMVRQKVGESKSEPGEPVVFKDENPNAPPDARYKALLPGNLRAGDQRRGMLAFKSPDGFHWTPMSDQPVLTDGAFDSQNLAFWDSTHGHYRAYWRYFTKGGHDNAKVWDPQGHRAIRTAISSDFLNWKNQQDLVYLDSPSEQLYTNQVRPYHRAPQILIGFPARYVERGHQDGPDHEARGSAGPDRIAKWSKSLRALPEYEHRQWRAKASERYGRALSESLLMASRDGVNFKRWNEAFLRPGIERPGTWNYGHQFIGWSPIETASKFDGAPNELSLFAVESYWTGKSDLLRRYTLRLDGFISASAPMNGGELITKPFTFTGKALSLNFSTSAAGSVRVELQDFDGKALPGLSLDECEELFGDTLERDVAWRDEPDLLKLTGKVVRLRFEMKDADVFSFQFHD